MSHATNSNTRKLTNFCNNDSLTTLLRFNFLNPLHPKSPKLSIDSHQPQNRTTHIPPNLQFLKLLDPTALTISNLGHPPTNTLISITVLT